MTTLPETTVRALKTLMHGVLLGVGAAAGAGALYLALQPALEAGMHAQLAELRGTFEPSVRDIEITGVRDQRLDGSLRFLGTATNHGAIPVGNLYVDVNFFAGDAFVNQCRLGVEVNIAPGASRPFVVDCGRDGPGMPVYDRYELSLLGASAPH